MALITQLLRRDEKVQPISISVLAQVNNNGNHTLTDGSKADTVTTERLQAGDNVVVVTDDRGNKHIIAGAR